MAPPNNKARGVSVESTSARTCGRRQRRTIRACVICHKKKVRCDIDEIEGDRCTPCTRDNYQCIPRERKRKRFTLTPSPPRIERQLNQHNSESSIPEDVQTSLSNTDSVNLENMGVNPSNLGQPTASNDPVESVPLLDRYPTPVYSTIHHEMSLSSANSTHTRLNSASYLGRLDYLHNDVPVAEDAGLPNKTPHKLSQTDIDLLQVQRVFDLPPRHVRESLMEAFWQHCAQWTPVVDRSWIDRDPQQVSLLLQHSILLAGSRTSVPLQDYQVKPEEHYKKARLLFWISAEADPIITIASACLLHWYNPEGPER
jgi:hypothetical protein